MVLGRLNAGTSISAIARKFWHLAWCKGVHRQNTAVFLYSFMEISEFFSELLRAKSNFFFNDAFVDVNIPNIYSL